MFSSRHVAAEIHAAARAVSGGPVYVSDAPGSHRQVEDAECAPIGVRALVGDVWAESAANLLPPLPPTYCPPCLPLTMYPLQL